jgi:hypothetical protein
MATPNLQIMLHYYSGAEHLFKTITMVADDERERIFDRIVAAKIWYWGRYAPENREGYMRTRLFVEARMYDAFSRQYWTPKQPHPVFFYIFPDLSLGAIEERLHQRQQYDELSTKVLLIDIRDLVDTTHISFTLCDSHRSYRAALIQRGLSAGESTTAHADHGTVFHINELAEVYGRHAAEDGLYFEVQVWDPEILEHWIKGHSGLTAADVAEQNGPTEIARLLRGEQARMETCE